MDYPLYIPLIQPELYPASIINHWGIYSLASGQNIKPVTFRLLRIAVGVCGMVIAWLYLPRLPAIVIGGIRNYIPGAWLDDRMKSRGRDIDQLLPIAMGRTAAGLLAGGSVPDVLQQVGESLEMKKTNPLTPELILTALEIRIKDRVEALRSLASRRSSVSLANLAQLLEGYTEAGGCLDPHSDLSQPGSLWFYPEW